MAGFWHNLTAAPATSPYVIAEVGVNHNGDVALAQRLIEEAHRCGASAVKFQSFSADAVVCRQTPDVPAFASPTGGETSLHHLLEAVALTHAEQEALYRYAVETVGIPFLSTPFGEADLAFLATLGPGLPFLKISSTDVNHLEFLEKAALTGKPLLLSTGMATLAEVEAAVETILATGNDDLALLHCVSLYPPEPEELNLSAITTLQARFPQLVIGYSDHSLGTWACLAATALGARILEKHFTLDAQLPGPDHRVSAEPEALAQIVRESRAIAQALGNGVKTPGEREAAMRRPFRRSLVSARPLAKGETLQRTDLAFKRPGTGLPPTAWQAVVGRVTAVSIPPDTPLTWEMLEGPPPSPQEPKA